VCVCVCIYIKGVYSKVASYNIVLTCGSARTCVCVCVCVCVYEGI